MTAHEKLSQFLELQYSKGLELWLDQGQLRFKGPKTILSKELIQALKKDKAEIISLLEKSGSTESLANADNDSVQDVDKGVDRVDAQYPLSMSQSAIWMLYRFAPNSPAYNTAFCARLSKTANIEIMQKAYQNILNRHAMLRSRFLDGEEGPLQQVMHTSAAVIDCIDANEWSEYEVDEWLKREAVAPFDLSQGQPLRTKCLQTATGNILIATIHHIAADLWSLLLIAGDLFDDFKHYNSAGYFNVKKSNYSYHQYVESQQHYMVSEEAERTREYWKASLSNAVLKSDMPTDFRRPAIMQMTTNRHSVELGSDLATSVREFCKVQAITPYVLFESAFQLLLYRYLGYSDFLIGTPTFGRSKQVLESVVGDFANPVVLRACIDDQDILSAWLTRNQKALFKVMALQDFPFPALVDLINPPRDASRTPLFQHMFVWHQGNKEAFVQQSLIEEILPLSGPCGSPYDILLSISDLGESFECHWMYQTSLYEQASIEQFSTEFTQIIYSLLSIEKESTIAELLDDIEYPTLDCCADTVNVELLHNKALADMVSFDHPDGASELTYSLLKHEQPVSCLHEKGTLQVFSTEEEVGRPLPFLGYYASSGKIVVSEIKQGWGIVNRKLVDLDAIVSRSVMECELPVYASQCHITALGAILNVLYVETSDDTLIAKLKSNCPEFDDVINLPRFEFEQTGNISRSWLLSIPFYDQRALRKKFFVDNSLSSEPDSNSNLNSNLNANLNTRLNTAQESLSNQIALMRSEEADLPVQYYPAIGSTSLVVESPELLLHKCVDEKQISERLLDRDSLDVSPNPKIQKEALMQGPALSIAIPDENIAAGLVRTAKNNPLASIQFVDEHGDIDTLSYGELLNAAISLSHKLTSEGIKPNDIVVLQISDRKQYFSCWWALVWLGAMPLTIAVPRTYQDDQPIARKVKQVTNNLPDCRVVTDSDASLSAMSGYISCPLLSLEELPGEPLSLDSRSYYQDNPVAFLQLTSGSTGIPKVIQISHRGILHQVYAAAEHNQILSGDRTLNWLPYDHVVPILTTHLRDVILGLEQFQVLTGTILADPLLWIELMVKHDINHSWSPNFGFKLVVDALKNEKAVDVAGRIGSLGLIKSLMNAGEQVTQSVITDFVRLLAPYGLAHNAMQPAFGMAESCTCITYDNTFSLDADLSNMGLGSTFVSLGGMIPEVDIRIADKNNHIMSEGSIGRMQIKGAVVTPGYLHNEEANKESFVGDGWFNSGDLGFIQNGQLVITGREKEVIIIRGVNYYCYEIEEIVTQVENVKPTFVAAFSVQCDSDGEQLVVCYVASDGSTFEDDVVAMNSIVNSEFGIEARYIIPVSQQNFHKTTSGKIQRSQFKQLFESGEYQQQCKRYDELQGALVSVPYHLYQADWEIVSYSGVEEAENEKATNSPIFCFDSFLLQRLENRLESHLLVGVDSVMDFGYGLSNYRCPEDEFTDNTVVSLLFSLPHVSNVEATTELAKKISDSVILLSQRGSVDEHSGETSKDEALIKKAMSIQVILSLPPSPLLASLWVKPLIDAITIEINGQNSSPLTNVRLRVLTEEQINDASLSLFSRLSSVAAPLMLREQNIYRPVLLPRSIDINTKETCSDGFFANNELTTNTPEKIDQKSVFVVTGGLGGVGLKLVQYLLEKHCTLIIVGRRQREKYPDVDAALTTLTSLYSKDVVSYRSIAQLNENEIENAIQSSLAELKCEHITGVFHLAGSYHKKMLDAMSLDDWQQSLDAKYEGSLEIANYLTKHWPSSMLVMFGSVNSYFGSAEIAGYSVANALQNQLTEYLNQQGYIKAFCLNWSLWKNLGMANAFSESDVEFARNKGFIPMLTSSDIQWLGAVLAAKPGCYWFGLDHNKPAIAEEVSWKGHAKKRSVNSVYCSNALNEKSNTEHSMRSISQWLLDYQNVGITRTPESALHVVGQAQPLPENASGALMVSMLDMEGDQGASDGDSPRNATDQLIMECWRSLLGNRVSHIDQTFFECGGNSVVVTQLAYKLGLRLQRQLPVSSIFEHPTIRRYSDYLQINQDATTSAFSEQLEMLGIKALFKGLDNDNITLLPANSSRPKHTIIYVSALIGLSHSYNHLLKQFDHCNQVLLGQDMLRKNDASIQVLAKRYVELLHREGVDLNYVTLVGWSFGGCVAFEMMSQLKNYNPNVVIVDSGIREAIPSFVFDDTVALPLFVKDLGLTQSSRDDVQLKNILPMLVAKGINVDETLLQRWFDAYKLNIKALRQYEVFDDRERLSGNIRYIKANGNPLGIDQMGWETTYEAFSVVESEADHQQVIYDRRVVEQINACIDQKIDPRMDNNIEGIKNE